MVDSRAAVGVFHVPEEDQDDEIDSALCIWSNRSAMDEPPDIATVYYDEVGRLSLAASLMGKEWQRMCSAIRCIGDFVLRGEGDEDEVARAITGMSYTMMNIEEYREEQDVVVTSVPMPWD